MRLNITILFFVLPFMAAAQVKSPDSRRDPLSAARQTATGLSRALVIGVSSYEQIDSLRFADDDAIEFASYLVSNRQLNVLPENITLLTNEMAKSGNVLAALTGLLELSSAGDKIYFYFSGHGDVEVTDSSNKGYLLVHDTPRNNYATGGISVDMLQKLFGSITDKGVKLFIVTDACRAGHLAGGASGVQQTARSFSTQWKNEVKILSAQPDEVSYESEDWGGGRGVFSFYLVKGMAGYADFNKDSLVTLSELEQYVGLQVSEATKYQQQPIFQGPQKFSNAVAITDKMQMAKYAEWDSDHEITVAVIKGGVQEMDSSCSDYTALLDILNATALDSSQLTEAFAHYKGIASCGKGLQARARYALSATLMNDVQQVVNQTLIGQKLVDRQEILFAQAKVDSLFSLNHLSAVPYEAHFRNLKTYLGAVALSVEGSARLSEETARTILIPSIDRALADENHAAYLYYAKGIAYSYGLHQFDSAIHYYQKASQQSPTWLMPKLLIGMTYQRRNMPDSAEIWLSSIERLDPSFRQFECVDCFNMSLAEVYLHQKKYKQSEQYFRKVYDRNPTFPYVIISLIYLADKTGNKNQTAYWVNKFDSLSISMDERLEGEEYFIINKFLPRKETLERLEKLKKYLYEYLADHSDQSEDREAFLGSYLQFIKLSFEYYYEKKYTGAFESLYDDWAASSPEPGKYSLKLLRIFFDHEPSFELVERIRETRDAYSKDLDYDDMSELDYMEAYTLLILNRKPDSSDEEANAELVRGVELLNSLLLKGYIDCNYLEKIRKRLRRLPQSAALQACK